MRVFIDCPVCKDLTGISYISNGIGSLILIEDGKVWRYELCECTVCKARIIIRFNTKGERTWKLEKDAALAETPFRAMDLPKFQHLVELVRGQAAAIKRYKKRLKAARSYKPREDRRINIELKKHDDWKVSYAFTCKSCSHKFFSSHDDKCPVCGER